MSMSVCKWGKREKQLKEEKQQMNEEEKEEVKEQ